ncbi:site-2 protease family protein [Candidatus Uhrbacteria bacterium]|nr:site-2 protease family protein [Candidatus Uhrbacteria bacterium]
MLLQLAFQDFGMFFVILIAIVTALTFHEYAHAFVANMLGDKTAEHMGRMTLNPIAHIDPWGLLMVLLVGFGYAKPVPYNPRFLKHPRRDSVYIGIAGPLSNILLASLFAIAMRFVDPDLVFLRTGASSSLLEPFLLFGMWINIALAVFNLLPIPPLDGSKLLIALLDKPKHARTLHFIERNGPMLLLVVIAVDLFGGIGFFSAIFNALGSIFLRLFGFPV